MCGFNQELAKGAASTAGAREERAGTCGVKLQKALFIYFSIFQPVSDTFHVLFRHVLLVPPEQAEQKHVSHLYLNGSFYTRE